MSTVDEKFDGAAQPEQAQPHFVKPGEIPDLALLPRRFDLFVAEMRTSLELVAEKFAGIVMPALESISSGVRDLSLRMDRAEKETAEVKRELAEVRSDTDRRLSELEKRLPRAPAKKATKRRKGAAGRKR